MTEAREGSTQRQGRPPTMLKLKLTGASCLQLTGRRWVGQVQCAWLAERCLQACTL